MMDRRSWGIKLMDAILVLGLLMMAVGVGWNLKEKTKQPEVELIKARISPIVTQVYSKVMIDVGGAVVKPGVYKLERGSRVDDALIAAGGLGAKADRAWVEQKVNRAELVGDGMKIYIPSVGDKSVEMGPNKLPAVMGVSNKLININSAGVEELDSLPGIGEAIAKRIIDYREKTGSFKDINELKLVSGIGEKLYEEIKDKVTL